MKKQEIIDETRDLVRFWIAALRWNGLENDAEIARNAAKGDMISIRKVVWMEKMDAAECGNEERCEAALRLSLACTAWIERYMSK